MNTPTINAPSTEPGIDPRPPNSDVPPITTAVIVAKLISSNEIAKEFIYIKFLEPEEKRKEEE